jgi:hypothetical protein
MFYQLHKLLISAYEDNSKWWTEKENATASRRGIFKVLSECSVGLIKITETSVIMRELNGEIRTSNLSIRMHQCCLQHRDDWVVNFIVLKTIDRTRWCRDNGPRLHSGASVFESRSSWRRSWLDRRLFVHFPCLSMRMSGCYLETGQILTYCNTLTTSLGET